MSKTRFSVLKDRNTATAATVATAPTDRPRGKKSDPAFVQVTVYLTKANHTEARKMLFDERRQFSDLVEELVREWIKENKKSGDSKV